MPLFKTLSYTNSLWTWVSKYYVWYVHWDNEYSKVRAFKSNNKKIGNTYIAMFETQVKFWLIRIYRPAVDFIHFAAALTLA